MRAPASRPAPRSCTITTTTACSTAVTRAQPYREAWTRIYARHPEAVLYPTMGGGGAHTTIQERYAHVDELADAGLLRLAIVDPGSVSLGPLDADGLPMAIDLVYQNTFADVRYMVDVCRARGVGAHVSIFEPGFLRVALAYHAAGRLPPASRSSSTSAVRRCRSACRRRAASLDAYLAMLEGSDLPWMVGVLGGDVSETLAELAIARGGHVRVGLEDYAGPASRATRSWWPRSSAWRGGCAGPSQRRRRPRRF